jgi:hypothetical protein
MPESEVLLRGWLASRHETTATGQRSAAAPLDLNRGAHTSTFVRLERRQIWGPLVGRGACDCSDCGLLRWMERGVPTRAPSNPAAAGSNDATLDGNIGLSRRRAPRYGPGRTGAVDARTCARCRATSCCRACAPAPSRSPRGSNGAAGNSAARGPAGPGDPRAER